MTIKPCPFCDNTEVQVLFETVTKTIACTEYIAYIYCDVCGCRGPKSLSIDKEFSKKTVTLLWNSVRRDDYDD